MTTNNTQTTDTTQILHTGQSEYWDLVKERTRMRNAISYFKCVSGKLKVSQIYEAYVCDLKLLIDEAAEEAGITKNDEFVKFTRQCAEIAKMPELEEPFSILCQYRTDAVLEAFSAMN